MPGRANISVVIAGNDGDPIGFADVSQPRQRWREFRLQREIDQVAGDGDVVGPLRMQVRDQRIEHLAPLIFMASARPVEIAERALARELGHPRRRQGRQMRIGQMRQRKGRHQATPAKPSARQTTIMP
jgi:hypothetical protein